MMDLISLGKLLITFTKIPVRPLDCLRGVSSVPHWQHTSVYQK